MDLKKIHEFVHKHRHKFIFILFIILFFVIYCVFIPLPLSAEDFVSVGYTTTIFSQTHNFMDLVLNYHYPHGSVLIEALLYYPFFYTKIWLQTYTLIPLLVHFAIFLAFYWFNFKYVKKYYILLNLLFIFPSMIFRTLLHMIGSQHEALLANAILILFFINFLKKQNKTNLIFLALMCGLTIFIETTSIIFVLAVCIAILLIKKMKIKEKVIYLGSIGIFSLIFLSIMWLIEKIHREHPMYLKTPLIQMMSVAKQSLSFDISKLAFDYADLIIRRIPRLFMYLKNNSHLLLIIISISLGTWIILHLFIKHRKDLKERNNQFRRTIIYFSLIIIALHILIIPIVTQHIEGGVDEIVRDVHDAFFSRHEVSLLIPLYLILVFGGLLSKNKNLVMASRAVVILIIVMGTTGYVTNYPLHKAIHLYNLEINQEYQKISLAFEEYQEKNSICGFHTTPNIKQICTFMSKGRLLLDCELHPNCPWETDYYEKIIRNECKEKRIGFIIPRISKSPDQANKLLLNSLIKELTYQNKTYNISTISIIKVNPESPRIFYVFYTEDPKQEEYLLTRFKEVFYW